MKKNPRLRGTLPLKKNIPVKQAGTVTTERYLDKQDLMQMLHISIGTLYNWRKKGILHFSKIQQKIYYKESELYELLRTKKNGV